MMQSYVIYINKNRIFISSALYYTEEQEVVLLNKSSLKKFVSDSADKEDAVNAFMEADQPEEILSYMKTFLTYVEAAGGLIKNESEEFLFINRYGKWDLPKGKLEPGETREQCAVREIKEECGLFIDKIIKPLPSTFHIYKYENNTILKRTYWFLMQTKGNQSLVLQREENIEDAAWIPADDFNKISSNTYPSVKDLINENNSNANKK